MVTFIKQLAAVAVTLALLACLGVTAFAADQSSIAKDESLPEVSREVSPRAEVSAVREEVSGVTGKANTENPKTGVVTVLPVILLGLAAGGTALLTGKER
mgnify:CR=1 FL=1